MSLFEFLQTLGVFFCGVGVVLLAWDAMDR
jgi:hypothetical protein